MNFPAIQQRMISSAITGVVVGLVFLLGKPLFAQADPSRAVETPPSDRLRQISEPNDRRLTELEKGRRSLDRTIGVFRAKDAPLYYVVYGLRSLGIPVCHEVVPGDHEWYLDSDGVPAFAADRLISVTAKDESVRSILDRICEADPRYKWTEVTNSGLVILTPKEKSRLAFTVGPVKDEGNPVEILARIDQSSQTRLAPVVSRGDNNLPKVNIESSRCSAMELLNIMAGQKPGLRWGFAGRVSFNYMPHTTADAVQIEFPALTKGEPADLGWKYDVVESSVQGVSTIHVKKTQRPNVAGQPRTKLRAVPGTQAAQIHVARETEQNVVASRLAGSWKLEPALTERLTGQETGAGTMVFVADPEVEKKVPARFLEAVKKKGLTLDIRMAGYVEMGGVKFPFILTSMHGNPHLFYFRERDGDPLGDSESFNVMLAQARDREKDLLFVGGDFNNQPFRAYERAPEKK